MKADRDTPQPNSSYLERPGQIANTSEKHENHNHEESETYASCWKYPTGGCETTAEIQLKKTDWPTQ